MKKNIEQIYNFATFIQELKLLQRYQLQMYWKDYPRTTEFESVADHSWRLAILILLFKDRLSKKINLEKALKMALLHDIAECVVGDADPIGNGTGRDTHAFNKKLNKEKAGKEKIAAKKIFALLPKTEKKHLRDIWLEYEERKSFESKVVKGLDNIEAMLQVLEYRKGHMFPKHLDFTIEYGLKPADVDPAIYEFGEHIAKKMKKSYKEFKK